MDENWNYKLVVNAVDGFDVDKDNLLMIKQREKVNEYLAEIGITDIEGKGWGTLEEAWWWNTLEPEQKSHVAALAGYGDEDDDIKD